MADGNDVINRIQQRLDAIGRDQEWFCVQLGYQAEKAAKARTEALKASANLRNSIANDIAAAREQRQQEIDDRREQWEYEQDRAEELARKQPYRLRGH